jgi:hypothetical protein
MQFPIVNLNGTAGLYFQLKAGKYKSVDYEIN